MSEITWLRPDPPDEIRSHWNVEYPEIATLERHAGRPEAAEIVAMERREADPYRRCRKWFGYGFYVARRR